MHTKQLSNNLGCLCGVRQLSGGVLYPFFPFQSLFKLPKISLKFMFTPALTPVGCVFMHLG